MSGTFLFCFDKSNVFTFDRETKTKQAAIC